MAGGSSYQVDFLGLDVYNLTLRNSKYIGQSINVSMHIVCVLFAAAAVVIAMLVRRLRSK